MSRRHLIITIEATGALSVEAVGYKGRGCRKASQPLIDALGAAASVRHKPEYQQQCAGETRRVQRLGPGDESARP